MPGVGPELCWAEPPQPLQTFKKATFTIESIATSVRAFPSGGLASAIRPLAELWAVLPTRRSQFFAGYRGG
jgi:hypothetical protein